MKTILFALLGLFLTAIIPVYAQEPSFDDQLVSSEEYTKLVTSDYILEQKITELQKTNSELNSKLENLTSQIIDLKDNGIKFGINETKLGEVISMNLKDETGWTKGDILVGSATIVAFAGLGSFLTFRIEGSDRTRRTQVTLFFMIYLAMFGIISHHLAVILSIMHNVFDISFYSLVIWDTIFFVGVILLSMSSIVFLQNRGSFQRSRTLDRVEGTFNEINI